MDEKSAMLGQLRIDRGKEPAGEPPRRWLWLAAIAVLLLIAGVAWWWLRGPAGVPVHVAVAQATTDGSGAAQAASMLDASGYVVARREATVSAKITGKVTQVLIEEGQQVAEGEVVARLDDTNIRAQFEQARAQLAYAKASEQQLRIELANAQRDYGRKQALLADHYVSQADLDSAQTTRDDLQAQLATAQRNIEVAARGVDVAQRALDDTVIRAPFAGVITVKAAQPGEIVSPISAGGGFTRTGIGTIVDMDSLEIEVDVNENFINRVHAGQQAIARLNAYPDWQIPAQVIAVIPTADRSKATVKVRVGFKQKDARILPEMGVRVSFLADAAPDQPAGGGARPGVRVPADAVQTQPGGTGVVYVIKGDTVERRAVRLGARTPDGQTILSGLSAGERVAIAPPDQPLSEGTRIKLVN